MLNMCHLAVSCSTFFKCCLVPQKVLKQIIEFHHFSEAGISASSSIYVSEEEG